MPSIANIFSRFNRTQPSGQETPKGQAAREAKKLLGEARGTNAAPNRVSKAVDGKKPNNTAVDATLNDLDLLLKGIDPDEFHAASSAPVTGSSPEQALEHLTASCQPLDQEAQQAVTAQAQAPVSEPATHEFHAASSAPARRACSSHARVQRSTRQQNIQRVSSAPVTRSSPEQALERLAAFCQPLDHEAQQALIAQAPVPVSEPAPPKGKGRKTAEAETNLTQAVLQKWVKSLETDAAFIAMCRKQAVITIRPQGNTSGQPHTVVDTDELAMTIDLCSRMIRKIDDQIEQLKQQHLNPGVLVQTRERLALALRAARKA